MINFLKIFILSLFLLISLAQASDDSHVKINLISSVDVAVAGQTIDIIIEKEIDPHWHTYWRNPGESGFPIQVKWNLPDGAEVSDLEWPLPRALDVQGIMNFVHEDVAYLMASVKLPDELTGDTVSIGLSADWLVCKEICIPESGSASIVLNIGEEARAINEDIFDVARATMPKPFDGNVKLSVENDNVTVELDSNPFSSDEDVTLFTYEWGLVRAGSTSKITQEDGKTILKFPRADRELSDIESFKSVLSQGSNGVEIHPRGLSVIETSSVVEQPKAQNNIAKVSLLTAILFAVIGGLILNLMPCVFPILSMKALSLVKIASKSRRESMMHGFSYTAGILLSFVALAGAIIALKAGGAEIGWGFQLQNPFVVTAIAWLLFVIGLNLFGVFDFSGGIINKFSQMGAKNVANVHGYTQDFFTGVLAVIVATPCTAPFMGVALGYALTQPPLITMLVFLGLGFGLALPFLLLSMLPFLQKIMPKPGAWMDVFRQFLAFPMWATVIWLVWVVVQQVGTQGLIASLSGMLIISFMIWLFKRKPTGLLKSFKTLFLILCVFGLWKSVALLDENIVEEIKFTPAVLEEALKSDDPVFVNMTAAWCITCKINEVTLKGDDVQNMFDEKHVTYISGDWTLMNSDITKYLESYGRTGVPLYVYYSKDDRSNPVVLPQILTKDIIEEVLEN